MALDLPDDLADVDVSRRGVLKLLGAGTATAGAGKAADNVLLGYGVVVGKNLLDQDLAAVAAEGFLEGRADARAGDHRLVVDGDDLRVRSGESERAGLDLATATVAEAREIDEELGLDGAPVAQVVADLRDVRSGEFSFAFSESEAFFDRVESGSSRPYTVDLVRGTFEGADPETVTAFTDADPADPEAVIEALVDAFREHAFYDIPRYLAGAVHYNVLLGTFDPRRYFADPVDFESLMGRDGTGMFCYEFTDRSIEALHAVPAAAQTVPVAGATTWDRRHKHVYTAIASVVREDGELVVPMTFVDYTHSTLYDDLHLRGLLGEGLEAYNRRHRATKIFWS